MFLTEVPCNGAVAVLELQMLFTIIDINNC
jgi:hypothetical protein